MTETVQKDGSVYLCGSQPDVRDLLDSYFERGWMILPHSSSKHNSQSTLTFCTVCRPEDFLYRLQARSEWQEQVSHQDSERSRRWYARKKAASA